MDQKISLSSKEELLETPMNLLGLGMHFNKYFFENSEKRYFINGVLRTMEQSDVLSLKEFIELNHEKNKSSYLITRRTGFDPKKNELYRQTTSTSKLIDFLTKAELDYQDCFLLMNDKHEKMLSELTKDELMELPAFFLVANYYKENLVFVLNRYFKRDWLDPVLIKDIMSIDDDIASSPKIIRIGLALQRMQRRLRRYGFNDGDGKFMRSHLDFL